MRRITTASALLILIIFSSCKGKNEESKKFGSTKDRAVSIKENEVKAPFGKVIITEPILQGTRNI